MIVFVRRGRASFTLVELLVVIAIIGVLTALIVGVAAGALGRARWARIKIEVDNLAGAVEAYKFEHGEYPPDFNDINLVRAHLRKRYPRWGGLDTTWPGGAIPPLDEAQALVFWLRGLSTNPLNPFDTSYPGKSFYDFKNTRLLVPTTLATYDPTVFFPPAAASYPIYVPEGGQNVPFIYFTATSYGPTSADNAMATAAPIYNPTYNATIRKMPYLSDVFIAGRCEWVNPTSFQVISAGPDGDWGNQIAFPVPFFNITRYPSGLGYIRGDMDNATNFSVTSLESARP